VRLNLRRLPTRGPNDLLPAVRTEMRALQPPAPLDGRGHPDRGRRLPWRVPEAPHYRRGDTHLSRAEQSIADSDRGIQSSYPARFELIARVRQGRADVLMASEEETATRNAKDSAPESRIRSHRPRREDAMEADLVAGFGSKDHYVILKLHSQRQRSN